METLATQDLLLIAEDAYSYAVPWPNEVLHDAGDVVLFHGRTTSCWDGMASRVRFDASSADGRTDEVRAWFAEHGRNAFTWFVGASARPDDLVERLIRRGAEPEPDEPVFTPMVLDHEPPPAPSGVEVRRVETLADFERLREVMYEGFAIPEKNREEMRVRLAEEWAYAQADDHGRYVAWIDGEPVAYAILLCLSAGPPYLGGAATLPSARGRGAYRALVRARWDEAVRRGTRALIVQAGKESRPILERLGFRGGPPIHVLVDHSGIAQRPDASR